MASYFSRIRTSNTKHILIIIIVYGFVCGCLNTYLPSMITTLEKRFELSSTQIGWLMGANDLGYFITVLPISYWGGRGNQSLTLSLSAIFIGISGLLWALPYFIFGSKYDGVEVFEKSAFSVTKKNQFDNLCNSMNWMANQSDVLTTTVHSTAMSKLDKAELIRYQNFVSFLIQMLGGIINGIAAVPFWTVGISFLDDIAKKSSGPYIGILYMVRSLSPVVGFSLASYLTSVHESAKFTVAKFPGTQQDPAWIGAWWLGCTILSLIVICDAPLLTLIKVKKSSTSDLKEKMDPEELTDMLNPRLQVEPNSKRKVQSEGIFQILKSLLCNAVYTTSIIAIFLEAIGHIVFMNYFTKYFEQHFRLSVSMASIMTAVCLALGSALGLIVSTVLSKRCLWGITKICQYQFILKVIITLTYPILFFFTCENVNLIGAHSMASCNSNCSCQFAYKPVCMNGESYLSACYAGCSQIFETNGTTIFGSCSCANGTARSGLCESSCSSAYGYVVVSFLLHFVGSCDAVQFTLKIMKIAKSPQRKPIAMAVIGMIWTTLGIAIPPFGGFLIDSVCSLWSNNVEEGSKGFCLLYDNTKFRLVLHSIGFITLLLSTSFNLLSYWKSKVRYDGQDNDLQENRQASHIS